MHRHLSRMTLREKIAQMVFIDFRFDDADYDRTMRLVKQEGVGGVRLFGGSIFELPAFVNSLQKVAKYPLLVTAEWRDGAGWEIPGATAFPPNAVTEELAQLKGRQMGLEARALGVRLLPAPAFGGGGDERNLGKALAEGLHSAGVLASVRGAPRSDRMTECRDYAAELDVLVIDAGLTAELAGEIRADLDFTGLVAVDLPLECSDHPNVERVARSGPDAFLAAGDPDLAIQTLEELVKAGSLSDAAVHRSVERILAAKERIGLFADRMTDVGSVETIVGGMMSRAAGQKLAEAAGVTLVRGSGRIAGRAVLLRLGDVAVLEGELAKRVTLADDADQCVVAIGPSDRADADPIREAEGRFKDVIVVVAGRDPFSQRIAARALTGEVPYRNGSGS